MNNPPEHTYQLPIARDYIRHWGLKEGVRELLQNALDHLNRQGDPDAPFEFAFYGDALSITSRRALLEAKTLLLGCTSKADDPHSIGHFGEGYKLALLVLLRAGYQVRVLNGTKEWRPVFSYSEQFESEVLTIEQRPLGSDEGGVTFEITGLSDTDCDQVRSMCLRMQPPMRDAISVPIGRILPSHPGKLYVGGLYVCDTTHQYGYDIQPAHLQLERDRQTVGGWELQSVTRDMWLASKRWDDVIGMLEVEAPDVRLIKYSSVPSELAEQAAAHFDRKHMHALPVATQEQAEQLAHSGYRTVITTPAMTAVLATAPSIKQRTATVKVATPRQTLETWMESNKRYLSRLPKVAFKKLIDQASDWKLADKGVRF